jgi:WD40 repeat protein
MYQDKIAQLEREKQRLLTCREAPSATETIASSTNVITKWHATIELCKNASCRVMTYCPVKRLGVVSMMNPTSLFPTFKFGVKKINFEESRLASGEYIPIHPKDIRDMAFNPKSDSLLLTASVDQTARFTDLRLKKVVSTITTDKPLWSCCWSGANPDQVFLG